MDGQLPILADVQDGVEAIPIPPWLLGGFATAANAWLQGGLGIADGLTVAAVKWTPWQTLRLPTLGGRDASVFAVNALGEFAGMATTPDQRSHATIWPRNNQPIDLGLPDGIVSTANTINVWSEAGGCGITHAVVWDRTRVATVLPFIPGLEQRACIDGLNDHSFAVGHSMSEKGEPPPTVVIRAALWLPDHSVVNLNDTVDAPNWVLTNAYGINNAGKIIGIGTYQGVAHGWMLTPAAAMALR